MVVLLLQQTIHSPEACSTFASAGLLGGIIAIWRRKDQSETDDDVRSSFREEVLDLTDPDAFPLVTNTGVEAE
jgi:hypothetical protein